MTAAIELLGGLVLEDGRRWREAATPWQWADARHVLEGPEPYSYLTRPRGASKTSDLAGIGIVALLDQLPAGSRSYAVAVDRDQAALLLDAMLGFLRRTPGLRGALRVDRWVVTNAATGATLEVLAADAAGAWGLRPHLLIADERAQWPTTPLYRVLWDALFSALPKVPGSRLVILTSAGDPAHPAAALLERARATPGRWYVNEVPGPCPWWSESDLVEQRAELTESMYRRLHLNEWSSSEDRLTSVDALRACVTLDGPLRPVPGERYVVAVDLGLTNDRTAVVVAHAEPMGGATVREASAGIRIDVARAAERTEVHRAQAEYRRLRGLPARPVPSSAAPTGVRVVLDRIQTWQGSRQSPVRLSEVEDWVAEAAGAFNRATVVYDPYQAISMAQGLRARGFTVEEFVFSSGSVGRLASNLYGLLRDGALALPDDPDLLEELANVRLRETSPGIVRLDHDSGRHDDRAVALGMAAYTLVNRPVSWAGPIKYRDRRLSGRGAAR